MLFKLRTLPLHTKNQSWPNPPNQ